MGKFRGFDNAPGRIDRQLEDLRRQVAQRDGALRIRSSTLAIGGDTMFVRDGILYFRDEAGNERPVVPLAARTAPFPNNDFESVDTTDAPHNWNAFWSDNPNTTTTTDWYSVGSRSLLLTEGGIAFSEPWTFPAGSRVTVTVDARSPVGVAPLLGIELVTNIPGGNPNYFSGESSQSANFSLTNEQDTFTFTFDPPPTHTRARLFLGAQTGTVGQPATVLVDNVGVVGGARPAQGPPGIIGAHVGDSISDRNGPYGNGERGGVANTTAYYPQLAWFQHAAIAAGQRCYVPPVQNFAVSGKRTDEMLLEQVPLVLSLSPVPTFCTVLGGTNDIATRTAAQIIASLGDIYSELTGAGITVIAGTIPPSTEWNTAPELATVCEVNRWIKKQATDRNGVHVVDFFTVLADTAGAPRSGVLADGTHQSGKGAAIMGAALAPILTTLFPPLDPFPGPGDVTNIAVNPFQNGTAGAKGTGVTGSIATSWFCASADAGAVTVVGSKVARTDSIPGEWTQLAITSGNVRYLSELTITTGFSIGESVQMLVEFQTDVNADTNTIQLEAFIASTGSSNTAGTLNDTAGFDGTEVTWTRLPRAGVLRTPPMVIGSGTTALALWVRIWGGTASTFRIGRMALVKV